MSYIDADCIGLFNKRELKSVIWLKLMRTNQNNSTFHQTGIIIPYIKIVICVSALLRACVPACLTFWIAYCVHTIGYYWVTKFWHLVVLDEKYITLEFKPLPLTGRRWHVITCTIVPHWLNIGAGKIDLVEKLTNIAPIQGRLLGNGGSQRYAVSTVRRKREWPVVWCVVCSSVHSTCKVTINIVRKWPL